MPVMEGSAPWLHLLDRVGIPTLLLNGAVAFALNIAAVFLIDSAGSVGLTLSGVFKVGQVSIPNGSTKLTITQDVLLITFSVILLGSSITPMQVVGECRTGSTCLSHVRALAYTPRLCDRPDGTLVVPAHRRFRRLPPWPEGQQTLHCRIKCMWAAEFDPEPAADTRRRAKTGSTGSFGLYRSSALSSCARWSVCASLCWGQPTI
jgi:hypothetical protein